MAFFIDVAGQKRYITRERILKQALNGIIQRDTLLWEDNYQMYADYFPGIMFPDGPGKTNPVMPNDTENDTENNPGNEGLELIVDTIEDIQHQKTTRSSQFSLYLTFFLICILFVSIILIISVGYHFYNNNKKTKEQEKLVDSTVQVQRLDSTTNLRAIDEIKIALGPFNVSPKYIDDIFTSKSKLEEYATGVLRKMQDLKSTMDKKRDSYDPRIYSLCSDLIDYMELIKEVPFVINKIERLESQRELDSILETKISNNITLKDLVKNWAWSKNTTYSGTDVKNQKDDLVKELKLSLQKFCVEMNASVSFTAFMVNVKYGQTEQDKAAAKKSPQNEKILIQEDQSDNTLKTEK